MKGEPFTKRITENDDNQDISSSSEFDEEESINTQSVSYVQET